ncbi:MAG: LPXTG cell wall anchor domain-containing protein [Oscillospiraceae bacterium]|nr:LPXTG cell wall anchor domain-containing protein [Oscillospiraceae bacterium]
MKKAFLSLAVALVLIAMLALPVLAANISLPADTPVSNGDTQQGWATEGFEDEGAEKNIDAADLYKATAIVLEVSKEPIGADIHLILQTPAGWWQDNNMSVADVYADGKITFDLSKMKDWKWDAADIRAKVLIAYYDSNIADLGITKAYAVVGGGGGGSAKTGDGTMIALALVALALAGGATVFIARKVKA